jgi:hypothetical protein
MGNALSWVIAKLFGDKEARILILGLDNGACAQARRRCGLLLSSFFSQSVHASLTSQVDVSFDRYLFVHRPHFVRSWQDVHSLPAKGRHLPFHRSKYVPPSAVRGLKDRRLGSRAPFVLILDDRRRPFTPDASHRHMHYRRRANPPTELISFMIFARIVSQRLASMRSKSVRAAFVLAALNLSICHG